MIETARNRRPAALRSAPRTVPPSRPIPSIPGDARETTLDLGTARVRLTNLRKPFWPDLGITKRDLLQYYADISEALLPHLRGRAMVMKRYPDGAGADFFFMKHAPPGTPAWIPICSMRHGAGAVDFPVIDNLAGLLWVVNLGCIDLNPWYARCDDVDRPDFLHFDLDPTPGAGFEAVREAALAVRDALQGLQIPAFAKTTGSRGIHVAVPIARGPTQEEVWSVARAIALALSRSYPRLITSEYRVASRPRSRVLVDYNQNARGRTLASVYSVRPTPTAAVSTPVMWEEIETGIAIDDFRIENVPRRVKARGDLWRPLIETTGRFSLESLL